MENSSVSILDTQSESFLSLLGEQEKIRAQKLSGIKTVLVVLSARGMVYDTESLRQKILLSYPEATVFFRTTLGKPVGPQSPREVDLLIDFTGPRQRQKFFHSRSLRRSARIAIGRNADFFRKGKYDRVFDEKAKEREIPAEMLERERFVQKQVLALAGVALSQKGEVSPDLADTIALTLPPLRKA